MHAGLSDGPSVGGRLHWGDEDGDGVQELGFGADIGPLSFDVRSEDLLGNLADLTGMRSHLPAGNLTQQGLSFVDGAIMDGGDAVCRGLRDLFTPDDQGLGPEPSDPTNDFDPFR